MRIQHNIMAMNAYRNYTNNVTAMKQNLEKLSSGYKINRAGDDAAGLAISEKMRAQITGLEQAQANAKSGINLVQTAEGALTEVHDMLNRMIKLADQSANGTFDDSVDRVQLQKEMDQLTAEINRIADSANFNGIKLLDGSMDAEGIETVNDATFSGVKAFGLYGNRGADAEKLNANEPRLHKDAAGSAKTQFTVDFGARTAKADDDGKLTLEIRFTQKDETTGEGNAALWKKVELNGLTAGQELTTEEITQKLYENIGGADHKVMVNLTSNLTAADTGRNDTDVEIEYEMSIGENGKSLVFTMTDAGYDTATDANKTVTGTTKFQGNFTVGMMATEFGKTVNSNEVGTKEIVMGSPSAGLQLAETCVDPAATLKDGSGIMVGKEYYVWATTDKTANAKYSDNVKVVDLRDLANDDGTLTLTDTLDNGSTVKNEAYSRLTVAAKDNKMFSVQYARGDDDIFFTEKSDNPYGDDLTTVAGVKAQIQQFTSVKANVTKSGGNGKSLTLQIGDTADSYNQLKVNIGDMHASALGLDKIKISDQDSAAAAADVIKAAINQVSDVRGTLGATQNRLDHTINNLSVMTENIQDAESTIRDVDIAEEMMAYTKNNILIQSAQAMLAQANQVPQGVLQLLQ